MVHTVLCSDLVGVLQMRVAREAADSRCITSQLNDGLLQQHHPPPSTRRGRLVLQRYQQAGRLSMYFTLIELLICTLKRVNAEIACIHLFKYQSS